MGKINPTDDPFDDCDWCYNGCFYYKWKPTLLRSITLPNGIQVTGDGFLVDGDDDIVRGVTKRIDITASQLPSLTIIKETPFFFNLTPPLFVTSTPHRRLGQARFETAGDQLTISNIGSSGEDGVDIDLKERPGGFDVLFDSVDLSQADVGLHLAATGTFMQQSETSFSLQKEVFLGSAALVSNRSGTLALADYSAIGASNVRVGIYNGELLVGSAVVAGGDPNTGVATLTGGAQIIGCGKVPQNPPCFVINFDSLVTVTPEGNTTGFMGNQLRLLADNALGTIDNLSHLIIRAENLASFTITGENVQPLCGDISHPILPADCNRDCHIDMLDLACLARSWMTWNAP